MKALVHRSELQGEAFAPPSKSYTHRAVVMCSLGMGGAVNRPLMSADTIASVEACRALGAEITEKKDRLIINGVKGGPRVPDNVIDVANSGTTLRLIMAVSALCPGATVLTGDSSIRKRPNTPLIQALNQLGAEVFSTREGGMAPIVVRGTMKGGEAIVDGGISSQFLSALLTACPLCHQPTRISVKGTLKSRPYVDITLELLEAAGITLDLNENGDMVFEIPPDQSYALSDYAVPGDFSSASYLLAAGALAGRGIEVRGLFPGRQGDATIIPVLKKMGARLDWDEKQGTVYITQSRLNGVRVDVGMTPDLVPTLAVLGAAASGEMVIENARHVRFKETDRLHAMTVELSKMGVDIKEEQDRLVIRGGTLRGASLSGWHDHRIVMAMTVAGLVAGDTVIDTAESVDVSFPGFFQVMEGLGADIILE